MRPKLQLRRLKTDAPFEDIRLRKKKNATLSDADVSKYLDQDISGYEKQWKNKL